MTYEDKKFAPIINQDANQDDVSEPEEEVEEPSEGEDTPLEE